jgi:hypothetical protein
MAYFLRLFQGRDPERVEGTFIPSGVEPHPHKKLRIVSHEPEAIVATQMLNLSTEHLKRAYCVVWRVPEKDDNPPSDLYIGWAWAPGSDRPAP